MYRILARILCATGLLLAATIALAQADQTTAAPASDSVNGKTTSLAEIIVTAERRKSRIQDVPFTVQQVSPVDLQKSGVDSTQSLPELVPGLTWGGQGSWAEPSLRGVSTTVASAGAGSPIAIYLDGVYQPEQGATIIDLPDVNDIEVLKGPQGTLFGMNATGGAILINTVQPSLNEMSGHFSEQAGQYSGGQSVPALHEKVNGYISGPIVSNVLAASVSAYSDYTPGYLRDMVNGGRLGAVTDEGARGKLLWAPADDTNVLLTAYYTHRDDGVTEAAVPLNGVTIGAEYPGAIVAKEPWTEAYTPPIPYYTIDNFGSSLQISQTFAGIGKLSSTTGYNKYSPGSGVDTDWAYSPNCVAAVRCFSFALTNPESADSEQLLFTSDQLGRLNFVTGLFWFYDAAEEHDRLNGGTLLSADTYVDTHTYAAFAEANYELTDALTLVAGIRFTHEDLVARGRFFAEPLSAYVDKQWNAATPRVSLKYKLSDALNVYATYSEGFKGGVVAAQLSTSPPANPEKLYSYEVGMKYAQRYAYLDLATFYYNYRNLQEEYNFGNAVVEPNNAASAQIYGVDLENALKPNDQFELKTGLEWLPQARFVRYPSAIAFELPLTPNGLNTVDPYDANGARMLYAPKLTADLTPSYTSDLPLGKLDASATIYYSSAYNLEVTGRVRQESYATINAQLGFTPKRYPDLRMGLFGRNLTARAIASAGAQLTANLDGIYYGPPREVGVSLDLTF